MQVKVHIETLDVCDLQQVEAFAGRLPADFADVDILVCTCQQSCLQHS